MNRQQQIAAAPILASAQEKAAILSGKPDPIHWRAPDGSEPDLSCGACGRRTPVLVHGLGFDCCAPPDPAQMGEEELPPFKPWVEGDYPEEPDDGLSAARGILTGLAIAAGFWLLIAGVALALGARPW